MRHSRADIPPHKPLSAWCMPRLAPAKVSMRLRTSTGCGNQSNSRSARSKARSISAELVTKTETSKESAHAFPHFFPDGKHFVYTAGAQGIYPATLDGNVKRRLAEEGSRAQYAPPLMRGRPGHLIYLREATLMAQPLDPEKFEPAGDAFPVADRVSSGFGGLLAFFSVAPSGALSYRSGPGAERLQLEWFDRKGTSLGTLGLPQQYTDVAISSDGQRIAAAFVDAQSSAPDIWLLDVMQGVPARFTSSPSVDAAPVWSPISMVLPKKNSLRRTAA
jgi:hypothetical protein